MKTTRAPHGWITLVIILLTTGGAFAQETPPPEPAYSEASCLVRITSNLALLPLNEDTVHGLLSSTAILAEPVRELLGPEVQPDKVGVTFTLVEQQVFPTQSLSGRAGPDRRVVLVGRIRLRLAEELGQPAASRLLTTLCDRLQAALLAVSSADENRLKAQLAAAEEELQHVEHDLGALRELRQELCKRAGRSDLSRTSVESTLLNLEQTRADAQLQLEALSAREQALARQISEIGKRVDETMASSEVLKELQRVVELRELAFQRVKKLDEGGRVSAAEAEQAERELVVARAQVAQYRETATHEVGGGLLADLNRQLIQLSIDSAEARARLQFVDTQLDDLRKRDVLALADECDGRVRLRMHLLEDAVEQMAKSQFELKLQLRNLCPPEVVVIGQG